MAAIASHKFHVHPLDPSRAIRAPLAAHSLEPVAEGERVGEDAVLLGVLAHLLEYAREVRVPARIRCAWAGTRRVGEHAHRRQREHRAVEFHSHDVRIGAQRRKKR